MIIEHLKKTNSTNEYIKKYIKKREDVIVRADFQTAGSGTKGRSFISEKGGLYVSKLTFYNNLQAKDAWSIMVNTAMAVVKTLMAFGVQSKIKWPNDIIVNGKKICGILTQNAFCGDKVDYSLVGIGINLNNPIAKEIEEIAISVKQVTGSAMDIESFFLTLMINLSSGATIEEYKSYSAVLGKKITVCKNGESFEDFAVDILTDGALLLSSGEKLYAGEIDLKIRL